MKSVHGLFKRNGYLLIVFIAVLFMFAGCSSSDDNGTGDETQTGTLIVSHNLDNGLPHEIDQVEYFCLDSSGNTVKKYSVQDIMEKNELQMVPITTKYIYMKYYNNYVETGKKSRNNYVEDAKAPVQVNEGQTTPVSMAGDTTANVYITGSNGSYTIMVKDNPFFIKGVGGDYSSAEFGYTYLNSYLQNSNVNTIRTYGVADPNVTITAAKSALAQANALSTDGNPVMVIIGLDLRDAADPVSYSQQVFNGLIGDTNADHILAWCISNEWIDLGNSSAPNNATVESISKWIQKQTPRTLTMVATQNPSQGSLSVITGSMPSLDLIGINSFYGTFNSDWSGGGFLNQLGGYISQLGKPWCLTEYYSYDLPSPAFSGYSGMPYQTLNGSYDYYLELNSTSNAQNYSNCWNSYVVGNQSNGCVGGCALNWDPPHNSQCNAFWKQMFVYGGQWEIYTDWYSKYGVYRLQCVDAVISAYGGTPSATACPQIVLPSDGDPQGIDCSFKADLNSAGTPVSTTDTLTATVTATGTGTLTFTWYLVGGEAVLIGSGGIWEGPSYNTYQAWGTNSVTSINLGEGTTTDMGSGKMQNTISFSLNDGTNYAYAGNNYQLRVIVHDSNNGAATAAIGFSVKQ